jgi:ABC-2 type transport system permease protein
MNLHRIIAIVLRHLHETRHNVDRLTDTIFWPLLDVVLWGFFTLYLGRSGGLRPGAGTMLLGAVILWGLFRSVQRDLAVGFLAEIWSRNIVNLFASPLTISEYMAGLVAVNFCKAALGMACAGFLAWICYAANLAPDFLGLVPFLGVLIVFALALGVVTTGLIFRYTTRIQTLAYSIAGILMPLSCVFYPVSSLPGALRPFALALPSTHAFEGMRIVIGNAGVSVHEIVWGYGLALFYFAAAIILFRVVYGTALRQGHLIRLD